MSNLRQSGEIEASAGKPFRVDRIASFGLLSARAELKINEGALEKSRWPCPVVELYLGGPKSTPEQTLSAAQSDTERCEAQFYIGEWHLIRSDRTDAMRAFKTAVETCPKNYMELTGRRRRIKAPFECVVLQRPVDSSPVAMH
jgi:hypothetical protein